MSPIVSTKLHFEKALSIALGAEKLSLENVPFDPKTLDVYYIVQFVILDNDDPVLSTGYYREKIQLQIFVCDRKSKGTVSTIELAEVVRNLFPKGYTAVKDGYTMHVLTTPRINSTVQVDSRSIIPVLFDIIVEVYN